MIRYVSTLSSVPVIACGAKSLNDMDAAINAGASGIAAGSFFLFMANIGRFNQLRGNILRIW